MAYPIKTFDQLRSDIIQEIQNLTGLTLDDEDDAAIRADGEAAVVEGLYHHQSYIQKQLFVATADEPFLFIHAKRLECPRNGGSKASGRVKATSNIAVTIPAGTKVTDGKGHYWLTLYKETLIANKPKEIQVIAEFEGVSWNFDGGQLLWVSPLPGVAAQVDVIEISAGIDVEDVEAWRQRMMDKEALGLIRDREADLRRIVKDVPGVADVFIFPKRRGLGSLDVAITAAGNPPNSPSTALLALVQTVLDEYAGFWGDVRAYPPTKEYLNITALVTGSVSQTDVEKVIRDYVGLLTPGETFVASTLVSQIRALSGVTDVQLTPATNQAPTLNVFVTGWLRIGTLTVTML
ncbi:baseplate J/gp47 family protein [Acinetobacter baumannii]|uniref:baseplate J/gp47 family protein n=1 Tax=Acinetobacter baumannii TaxID=470 RepID=UPI00062C8E80|nr:baseplate J/gp47 family protein [Acinetobacter baumannii]KKZ49752.1 mu-like prophage FluMu protein gp47 [Acinetobacter baumannii]MDC3808492.1 baseplate J/gp47 family protein [Acinetobacter baumannii]MDC4004359.1 baseplate J/gp47 family protein [Acinetobacter baumannii]MDC4054118.1 baseplate J/gp47 family protein [Acinetobacter baumannii]MDC4138048.1 baseplate J/gp47 family protein [Acinetobacter baumannii]